MPTPGGVEEAAVERFVSAARSACPGLTLDEAAFRRHLTRIDPPASAPAADLALAFAALSGDPTAVAQVDRMLTELEEVLRRRRFAPEIVEEVLASVRAKLFLPRSDEGAGSLEEYRGSGELRGWLRVVVTRAALRMVRTTQRRRETSDDAIAEMLDDRRLEDQFVKGRYREVFRSAVERAFGQLTARQRAVLRQNVLDGISVEALASLYGVHRVTVSKWLGAARATLAEHVVTELRGQLHAETTEIRQLYAIVESQLDLSLSRILGSDPQSA
jgi:RNA polymerase sigma-70 factor (ECF subfamily)